MSVNIVDVMLVISGLVLLSGSLYLIPAMGKYLEKLAKWLSAFQAIIGIIAIIVGIFEDADLLGRVTLIVAGLIMAVSVVTLIPAIGKYIAKFVKFLGAFQTIIGIIALVLGIWLMVS